MNKMAINEVENDLQKLIDFYSRTINGIDDDDCLVFVEKNGEIVEAIKQAEKTDQCLHLTQVTINMGGQIIFINRNGVNIVDGKPTGRGVSIFRQYYDEEGKIYETQEQFHKGIVYKKTEIIGAEKYFKIQDELRMMPQEDVPQDALTSHDIWRD
jgi:hypothetical protein